MDRPPVQIRRETPFHVRNKQGLTLTAFILIWLVASAIIAEEAPRRFTYLIVVAALFLFPIALIVVVPAFDRWRAHRKQTKDLRNG